MIVVYVKGLLLTTFSKYCHLGIEIKIRIK